MSKVLLSILIPTLETRKVYFNAITKVLSAQINRLDNPKEVEILSFTDNRKHTTGHKRNVLIKASKGKFVVHVDDDDRVAPNYVELIVKAIKENPDIDAIGIRGQYQANGGAIEPFETSLKHHWEKRNGWYYRTINHISPILREHAISVQFPDITQGEDHAYTMALKETGRLKKEVVITERLYFYDFVSNKQY